MARPRTDGLSGESPDVVCHELGHALLDSFKPQLFDAASMEVAAFHESFGDMSALLSALQLPSVREGCWRKPAVSFAARRGSRDWRNNSAGPSVNPFLPQSSPTVCATR